VWHGVTPARQWQTDEQRDAEHAPHLALHIGLDAGDLTLHVHRTLRD